MEPAVIAGLIFALTYVLISLQKIHFLNLDRPSAALLGAVLMVTAGVLSPDEAYRSISHDTLTLLLGMMVIVAYLRKGGFFRYVSRLLLRTATTPRQLLALVVFVSGTLSACFVNDTICLLFTPIILESTLRARLDPVPYLIALATASNTGSVMMLTGNPQNMLIGISSGIPFGTYSLRMIPVGLVCLAVNAAIVAWVFRGRIPDRFEAAAPALPRVHRVLVGRILVILGLMILGFLLPTDRWLPSIPAGQKLPAIAIAGAAATILIGRFRPRDTLALVDWPLLLFFCGLFIVMAGVEKTGLVDRLHQLIQPHMGATPARQVPIFALFTLVGCNLVSNVPFVMLAGRWIGAFADPTTMWYVLALVSTFAGNLTLVGSVANLIVVEASRERAPIDAWTYLRAGVPVTLATVAVGLSSILLVVR